VRCGMVRRASAAGVLRSDVGAGSGEESGGRERTSRKGAKLASQESLPREGRAAAMGRLAMGAVVEWADGLWRRVRRGWSGEEIDGIGPAAPCGLGRKRVSRENRSLTAGAATS
jgi:hypothetical protein